MPAIFLNFGADKSLNVLNLILYYANYNYNIVVLHHAIIESVIEKPYIICISMYWYCMTKKKQQIQGTWRNHVMMFTNAQSYILLLLSLLKISINNCSTIELILSNICKISYWREGRGEGCATLQHHSNNIVSAPSVLYMCYLHIVWILSLCICVYIASHTVNSGVYSDASSVMG